MLYPRLFAEMKTLLSGKQLKTVYLSVLVLTTGLCARAQQVHEPTHNPSNWSKDYKPFRIVGNLYYVGTDDLASYLITTAQGHILINTGLANSADMIRTHVQALGFKFSDIRILLATHAHFDHAGGMARVKKGTHARMLAEEQDAPVFEDGGNSDFIFGGKGALFAPIQPDGLLHDHDTIKLGGMQIVLLHHPGHTKGACSYLFDVKDSRKTYRVLIANMPSVLDETNLKGMDTYPDVGKDYAYTFQEMKKLQFDIFLASHASQFDLHKKHQPGAPYNPAAFIDPQGFYAKLDTLEKAYLKKLNSAN